MTLIALTALVLSAGPTRIHVCGPTIQPKPKVRILPRTAPVFADFGQSPAAFEEPRDRPRSFASIDGSPVLTSDGLAERKVSFRRHQRRF